MAILVIAEHDNTSIKAATLNAVSAAAKIGGELHLLVAGSACAEAAQAAARIAGVSKVLVADAAHYADQLPENLSALVVAQAAAYSHILAAATTSGKNFMPRVAALLDVAQVSEIIGVVAPDTFVRPIYAGNVVATVQSSDPIKVVTVRATAFEAAGEGGSAAVESLPAGVKVTAMFGTDGRVSGSSGCNTYNGPFTVDGQSIKIGPVMSTMMACEAPAMQTEQLYLKALSNAAKWSIDGGNLFLRDASGAIHATYAPMK